MLSLITCAIAWAVLGAPSTAHAGCKDFVSAKQADPDDRMVKEVIKTWRKVNAPFQALTGRQTGLVVLHQDARRGADKSKVFKPTAHICPGAPPVVYVTWPMVEAVFSKTPTYPEAFLAFAIGHELGHRVNDLNDEGGLLGAHERANYGTGYGIEEMADKRAAFLAATAGYSMQSIADDKIVSSFLTTEHSLRPYDADMREQMLVGTLSSFDAYENLYDLAVAMTMSGEDELGLRLLARADELITSDSIPLPEVKALRAIALMNSAAQHAPWTENLSAPITTLRCAPIFPSHTALRDDNPGGALRSGDDMDELRRVAAARLKLAGKLLDQAEEFGVNPIVLHSSRACLAIYKGSSPAVIDEQMKLAYKSLGKSSPKPLRATLDENKALAKFVSYVVKHPMPASTPAGPAKKWGKRLGGKLNKVTKKNRVVHAETRRLSKYPSLADFDPANTIKPKMCEAKPAPQIPAPQLPETSAEFAACPKGWRLLHTLPPAAQTQSPMGITTCAPEEALAPNTSDRLITVTLPGAMEPKLPEIKLAVVIRDFTDTTPSFDELTCGCNTLRPQGTSDRGERSDLLICPRRGLFTGIVTSSPDKRVTRITTYEELD